MNDVKAKAALKQYSSTKSSNIVVEEATPHRLIQMLLDAAIEKVNIAKGCIDRKEIREKNAYISWATEIVLGLQESLDLTQGGEIAKNLTELYDYIRQRLLEANLHDNSAHADEVIMLLRNIKSGWDAIPTEFHNK